MHAALRAALVAAGCSLLPPAWPQELPPLEDALARIRENVSRFETSLPDFLCSERVTSRSVVNGKTAAEVVNESTIAGTLKDFIEAREIVVVKLIFYSLQRKVPATY